jgi:hypothetical protein
MSLPLIRDRFARPIYKLEDVDWQQFADNLCERSNDALVYASLLEDHEERIDDGDDPISRVLRSTRQFLLVVSGLLGSAAEPIASAYIKPKENSDERSA